MKTWWVRRDALYDEGNPGVGNFDEVHVQVVKLADVEALERRVAKLTESVQHYTNAAASFQAERDALRRALKRFQDKRGLRRT